MKIVFTQPDVTAKAVVKTSDFKHHFPNVNSQKDWKSFVAFIKQATREYVIPLLGWDLYNDITDKIDGDAVPEALEDFVSHLKDVVAYYTIYFALPKDQIVIANFGLNEAEGRDGSAVPVRQWVFNSTLWNIVQTADKMMDQLLEYMEANLSLEENYLGNNWTDKDVYRNYRDPIFRLTSELSLYININNSRRAYLRLIPHIKSAGLRFIIPTICQDQMYRLIEGIEDGDLTGDEKLLLEKIKPALANYALHIGIPHIRVVVDGSGISVTTITSQYPISGSIVSGKSAASDEVIHQLSERALSDAETARADLLQFLYGNSDTYPLWRDSACNQQEESVCLTTPSDGAGGVFL